jgi:hypothetical protein
VGKPLTLISPQHLSPYIKVLYYTIAIQRFPHQLLVLYEYKLLLTLYYLWCCFYKLDSNMSKC